MSSPYVCKWGILACGGIAQQFAKDVLLDPKERGAGDIQHEIVAVSSSTSVAKAQDFVKKTGCSANTKAYGNYEEFVKDPNVDIVYIATPNAFHYEHVLLCLNAGKNKPFTINAKHTAHLIKVAREKNLFLMEAVWTRFVPAVQEILRLIHKERILGDLVRVYSDLSEVFPKDPKARLYDPAMGGGALLDLGVYPLTWQLMTLYEHPDNEGTYPQITSSFLKSPLTGVDDTTVVIGNYPKIRAQGIATTCLLVDTSPSYSVLIQGEKGDIRIPRRPQNPQEFTIELRGKEVETRKYPIPGWGLFYEADAAARGLRDGKKTLPECDPEKHSLVSMKIMDEVRAAGGFKYADEIEATRE